MAKSKLGQFNWRDLLHAFIITFLSSSLTGLIQVLDSGMLPTLASMKVHAVVGLTAGLSYVLKVLLENSNGQFMKGEKPQP